MLKLLIRKCYKLTFLRLKKYVNSDRVSERKLESVSLLGLDLRFPSLESDTKLGQTR